MSLEAELMDKLMRLFRNQKRKYVSLVELLNDIIHQYNDAGTQMFAGWEVAKFLDDELVKWFKKNEDPELVRIFEDMYELLGEDEWTNS